jgi:hypothetical protein
MPLRSSSQAGYHKILVGPIIWGSLLWKWGALCCFHQGPHYVKECHALSYWHLQLSLILNRAHLQTKKSTHLQIARIQAQNTKWNTHRTRCQNEACIKHNRLTTINLCVFKSQITKSDLRTHNLKLYPKHKIT